MSKPAQDFTFQTLTEEICKYKTSNMQVAQHTIAAKHGILSLPFSLTLPYSSPKQHLAEFVKIYKQRLKLQVHEE